MRINNKNRQPKLKHNAWTKFVFFSDNHGDMQDDDTVLALTRFLADFSPDIKIHGGDGFDIRSLRKNAIGAEEYNSMDRDIEMGLEFLEKTKPDVYHYGNHEHRLFKAIESSGNGIVRDYCKGVIRDIEYTLRKNGCKLILPYHAEDGVFEMGPISTCHGYSVNQNSVREHAVHYSPRGGATLIGHLHTIMQANAKRHKGVVGFCGGALCNKKKMGYAHINLNTSSWGNGWLYGWVKGKDWKVLQAHKVGGKWLAPIDFKLY